MSIDRAMTNPQHEKNRQESFRNYTIKHVQTAPVRKPEAAQALIDQQKKDFKSRGGKIKKIKDGVTGYQDMSRREVSAKKGKIKLNEIMSEEIHCKGCTGEAGKVVKHAKSQFPKAPDGIRGYALSCRANKLKRAKAAELKRRRS